MFIIMRALGEMAAEEPTSGSFSRYAAEYAGPFAGFLVGWTYWLFWIFVDMAELTAFGVYVNYWFPAAPRWLSALVALLVIVGVNLTSVRFFGEAEFWFALIKVVAILALIAFGSAILVLHLGHGAAVANLWDHGGFLPRGIYGVLLALPLIMFSFGGTELVGITAGETDKPRTTIPRAVNQVITRILLFYVGALFFIMALEPWTRVGSGASPFVTAFRDVGLPAASGILNFVVITAALSAFNSGMYSTGRMLLSLAERGQAPRQFKAISQKRKVPYAGIVFSACALSIGVVIDLVLPSTAYLYLSSVATLALVITWTMILLTHWRFRRQREASPTGPPLRFPLFGWPYTIWVGSAGLALVAVMMAFSPTTRPALYSAPAWLAVLAIGYQATIRRRPGGGHRADSR